MGFIKNLLTYFLIYLSQVVARIDRRLILAVGFFFAVITYVLLRLRGLR